MFMLINTAFLALCRVYLALFFVSLQRKDDIPNMDQIKIGKFLKDLRKGNNLTQEQLAKQLNVSARTVSRWETGNNLPNLSIQEQGKPSKMRLSLLRYFISKLRIKSMILV